MFRLSIILIAALSCSSALSLEHFYGKVTFIEPTYMPQTIVFSMDVGNVTCPVGAYLKWSNPDIENKKIVYSTLLTAFATGKKIRFHFNDGDSSCEGTHIHLQNDQ